ncbi:DNA repair helicase RAD25 [Spiromyces aspiralis]|uniref:DNA repair helicase RAD25 n=1 Tax=Spiromyces aspiralis TaxID=68401 RepID=A0ACC1HY40_9FUNG|nr:DNA repair helicase RAD25 [Spiromyces aspiralis]
MTKHDYPEDTYSEQRKVPRTLRTDSPAARSVSSGSQSSYQNATAPSARDLQDGSIKDTEAALNPPTKLNSGMEDSTSASLDTTGYEYGQGVEDEAENVGGSDGDEEEEEDPYASAEMDKLGLLPRAAFLKFGGTDEEMQADLQRRKDAVSSLFKSHDYSNLLLKKDHASRPLWICPDTGRIILEAFSPLAELAIDFLIAISEPVTRPAHMHEYKLTLYSLYAAASVGLETEDIINVLNQLSKIPLSKQIVRVIRECTVSYGKVRLVLKHNHYYVESSHPEVLQKLLRDPIIAKARVVDSSEGGQTTNSSGLILSKQPEVGNLTIGGKKVDPRSADPIQIRAGGDGQNQADVGDLGKEDEVFGVGDEGDNDDDDDNSIDGDVVHSFEIDRSEIENVKRQCNLLDYPMLEEYDFRNDTRNPNLDIDLKPITSIRPYQEKSLSKMFGNGRARSGIIVLPCGAGKTLVGITAACTIKKSVLCLCTSAVSVMQWRQQFLQWSTIKPHQIAVFTSGHKEQFEGEAGIVISTFSMVANTRKRSYQAQKMMDFLQNREWGFLLLDEVHVVPAAMFRRVITTIAAHVKLGLTATLVREDDKIDDLNFLIGPKLYEANWMDLSRQGHIATVQCAEVWCDMTPEFYEQYLQESSHKKRLYYGVNPNKLRACKFLINYHERRGDKIIVFSDNIFTLRVYMEKLGILAIYGAVGQQERMRILHQFQHNPKVNTIILSTVGDTSIDLPEATCLIQVSSHYGSRRQEAQRLGRILRAKRRNDEGFNAFFYSLVSKDTEEMFYSTKRQQFLLDQGYSFKTITSLEGIEDDPNLFPRTKAEEQDLLATVLRQSETVAEIGDMTNDDFDDITHGTKGRSGVAKVKRSTASLQSISGNDGMAYTEFAKRTSTQTAAAVYQQQRQAVGANRERHPLFQKRNTGR